MSESAKLLYFLLSGIGGLIMLLIVLYLTENTTTVVDLPGKRQCYAAMYENNRLFGEDTVTRTVWCVEKQD